MIGETTKRSDCLCPGDLKIIGEGSYEKEVSPYREKKWRKSRNEYVGRDWWIKFDFK